MPKSGKSKEDAPTDREYRALLRGAQDGVKEEFQLECTFAIRMMGELGMRAGELAHISEGWVDFEQCKIRIPEHDPCESGKEGAICGYCHKRAGSRVEHSDLSFEEALEERWEPKLEASARTLPYSWNKDIIETVERFFNQYERWPTARVGTNRRVDRVAEATPIVDKSEIYPHALRARAAKFHAREGLRAFQLKKFMGWSKVDGAMEYIKMVSSDVEDQLERIHGARR